MALPRRIPLRPATRQTGMTLLEIMIVLAILGTVMAFLIGPTLMKQWEESRIKTTRILLGQYESALIFWRTNHLAAECPATLDELYTGGLVNAPPRDPYDQRLEYHCPARDGAPFEVYSTGPDRRDGTEDDIRARPKKP